MIKLSKAANFCKKIKFVKKKLKREIVFTEDGSTSLFLADWQEGYHSKHGAIQEAKHVFIKNGLQLFENQKVNVLEIGFGTGLNAFITYLEAKKKDQKIDYIGVEAFPVLPAEAALMNYVAQLDAAEEAAVFEKMHQIDWNTKIQISDSFCLTKRLQNFEAISDQSQFDLIYFDAFGYRVQPDLWSTTMFQKMFEALKPGGVLVTYAARGVIKRSMIEVGFLVEKLPGAPGKREMMRARKP